MESILMSIKKLLGIEDDYVQFDADVRMNINAAFSTLTQIGVGPSEGFLISDKSTMWSEFLGERKDSEFVKMYIYLKVRLGLWQRRPAASPRQSPRHRGYRTVPPC